MTVFESRSPPFVPPRDDLTIPQFILDDPNVHATRPKRDADAPCLIDEVSGKAVYLPELQQRSHALARALKAKWNIGPGDVVSMYSLNQLDYMVVVWAVHRLGGTVAAHSAALTAEELEYQLKIAEPVLLVGHPALLKAALTAAENIKLPHERIILLEGHLAPEAPFVSIESLIETHETYPPYVEHKLKPGEAKTAVALLCYSSGTTGNPKAVKISHYSFLSNVIQNAIHNRVNEQYAKWEDIRFRPGDICGGALPFFHMYGFIQLHFMIYVGMTVVVSQVFVYENFLRSIQQYKITHLLCVPPQVILLVKHPLTKKYDLSSIRAIFVSAAPLSASLTEELLQLLPNIQLGQGYGMTEGSGAVSLFPVTQRIGALGSAGQLLSGTFAKVVKQDGTLAGVGETGELYVQGPQVALGYYHNDEATRETFVDGWLRTGDEVRFDENGEIFITDRIKELIKVKGLQVAPSELEGRLLDHFDVADAAVIGVPHDYTGEAPRAYVVLKPAIADSVKGDPDVGTQVRERLYDHVSASVAKYKRLDGGIEFVDAVPKNASGKILRRVLKEQSKAAAGSASSKL